MAGGGLTDLNMSSPIEDNCIIQALNYLCTYVIKSSQLHLALHVFSGFV